MQYIFRGKTRYAGTNRIDQYGKYNYSIYPDDESLKLFRDLQTKEGVKNSLKMDEDGEYFNISRPHTRTFKSGDVLFGPPKVSNIDGTPFNKIIGRGSLVKVIVEGYSYTPSGGARKLTALRLEEVVVEELVPYEGQSSQREARKLPF